MATTYGTMPITAVPSSQTQTDKIIDIVNNGYERDTLYFDSAKFRYMKHGFNLEIASKILVASSIIPILLSYWYPFLVPLSGSIVTVGTTCSHLATYLLNKSKQCVDELNHTIVTALGPKTTIHIPDVIEEDDDTPANDNQGPNNDTPETMTLKSSSSTIH
jgi:hypothetical protein